jgi:hypothetical protein
MIGLIRIGKLNHPVVIVPAHGLKAFSTHGLR